MSAEPAAAEAPNCPKCQGPMWDNRESKRNPRAPDFKCKDKSCEGVVWPPRDGRPGAAAPGAGVAAGGPAAAATPSADGMPNCPICGGAMWDDRLSKRNPRAPDFKCRNRPRERGGPGCEGVIWPPREGMTSPYPPPVARAPRADGAPAPGGGGWGGAPSRGSAASKAAPPPYDAPPPDDRDFDAGFAGGTEDDDLPF